jgi:hypothetical protein
LIIVQAIAEGWRDAGSAKKLINVQLDVNYFAAVVRE